MPCVNLKKSSLCAALGREFTQEEFEKLCFDFGIELDEVLEEVGEDGAPVTVWKIEIAANRYDLLCLEGLARALRVFRGEEPTPVSRPLCILAHANPCAHVPAGWVAGFFVSLLPAL